MNGKEEPDCLETTLNLSVQRQEEIRQRFEGKICELLTKLKNIARKDDNKTNQNSIIFCNKGTTYPERNKEAFAITDNNGANYNETHNKIPRAISDSNGDY